MKQIDSLIDQATLDLDKEVEEINSESTKQKPQPVDFLTHLIETFVELPEIQNLKNQIIPRAEARIEASIRDYLKFGEPDAHNPLETFIVKQGQFEGSTYFGETNKQGQPNGRGIIFDAGLILISRFDDGEDGLGATIGIDEEEDRTIAMVEYYRDEFGDRHGKGMKFKMDGTKKPIIF